MENRLVPDDRSYWIEDGKIMEHIWIKEDKDAFAIGFTDIGLEMIGDVVSISATCAGNNVGKGDALATVESSKWVGQISSPFSGKVSVVNGDVIKNPGLLNENPYDTWFVKIEPEEKSVMDSLLSGDKSAKLYASAAALDLMEE